MIRLSNPPKKSTHTHTVTAYKNTTEAAVVQSGSCGPKKWLPLTWSESWQTGQTTNNHPRSDKKKRREKRSKRVKTNMSDVIKVKWQALCETDWRVYSYLLLPRFQYQHHRKHWCFPFPAADSQREAQTASSVWGKRKYNTKVNL